MDIFDVLNLIGGLCLFLFGMELMGAALERRAGSGLKSLLGKLTQNKLAGFVWTDLITNLERTADHCSSVAACTLDAAQNNMNIHEFLADIKQNSPYFKEEYQNYLAKYSK